MGAGATFITFSRESSPTSAASLKRKMQQQQQQQQQHLYQLLYFANKDLLYFSTHLMAMHARFFIALVLKRC